MAADKEAFYRLAARSHDASTQIYRVDSVVHVEDEDDIWFWQKILSRYRGGRYKFRTATVNEHGNKTTGCAQCLKYRNYLSQRFFVCIDSDLRYLLDEDISAENGILQTYAYSWENHCVFAESLQETFDEFTGKGSEFDFVEFLRRYSAIVYEPFLLMLYQEREGLNDFDREKFRALITLTYRKGDEAGNGRAFLERLQSGLAKEAEVVKQNCDFNFEEESARYAAKGLGVDNAYLYVRGHCLYNSIVSIGKKLCIGTGVDFEQNILKSEPAFEQYDAMNRIKDDVGRLNGLRRSNIDS